MDNTGKFMTYKGTDKIVYVIDDNSTKTSISIFLLEFIYNEFETAKALGTHSANPRVE